MIPKVLSPDVRPFAEILIVGLPTPRCRLLVCAQCEMVITPGRPPATRGLCEPCFDQAVA